MNGWAADAVIGRNDSTVEYVLQTCPSVHGQPAHDQPTTNRIGVAQPIANLDRFVIAPFSPLAVHDCNLDFQ